MITFLFVDLDDTILDFHQEERIALSQTLRAFGLEPTEEVMGRYSQINKGYWERLERKEISREEVLVGRFASLFQEFGIQKAPERCARAYEENLAKGHIFLPGAEEALERLSKKYKLYLASNGTASVQDGRLTSSGIGRYFEEVFVSQQIGANKPDRLYFERCFAKIPGFDVKQAMIVGDSLTSDILGGKQAGMATCWINPTGKPAREDIQPDYEIQYLSQLEALLAEKGL